MGYTPRGYHFDLKTILSNPDPIIDLRIPIYEESSQSFLNAVNNYKNKSIAVITDKRARDAAELKKLQEKVQKVEVETNKAKVQELELISRLEREQAERNEAELTVSTYKRQIASIHERNKTLQAQIDEYRSLNASLKKDKGKERAMLKEQGLLCSTELHAFESILGCDVEGMQKEQLLIRFRSLDLSDQDREFSFILDVTGSDYKVMQTSPPLPSLPLLVDKLNVTRDIFAFIIHIRQEFQRMANGEQVMNTPV